MITREAILEIVKENFVETVEDGADVEFDPTQSFKELGASSLDIVEIVARTMQKLRIKVPRSRLTNLKNVDAFVDVLIEEVSSAKTA